MGDERNNKIEALFLTKNNGIRISVAITCSLSIICSILIILSYVCYRSLRTKVRLILVHISVMDLGVAAANLTGLVVDFNELIYHVHSSVLYQEDNVTVTKRLCEAQAYVALYSTYGSILWTNCLVLYLYFAVIHHSTSRSYWSYYFSLVFSYLLPVVITTWLLATNRLGATPYGSVGWCSIIGVNPITHSKDYIAVILGMCVLYTCMYVCTLYVCMYVCMYVHCMHVFVCMYIVCMYV